MVEAVVGADVASGLDAAFKTVGAVDGASFIQYLLVDCIVGTQIEGGWADRLCCSSWARRCRGLFLGGR